MRTSGDRTRKLVFLSMDWATSPNLKGSALSEKAGEGHLLLALDGSHAGGRQQVIIERTRSSALSASPRMKLPLPSTPWSKKRGSLSN